MGVASPAAERAVGGALAAAAARAAGWDGGAVFLFSEVFVVKPARSATSFAWHRDDDRQLRAVGGAASGAAFCSTWAPLCATSAANGTLTLRSRATGRDETAECGPRDVVVFDRSAWHASGPNASGADRAVHYAQFSPRPIAWGGDAAPAAVAPPLWLAVPRAPARSRRFRDGSRRDSVEKRVELGPLSRSF